MFTKRIQLLSVLVCCGISCSICFGFSLIGRPAVAQAKIEAYLVSYIFTLGDQSLEKQRSCVAKIRHIANATVELSSKQKADLVYYSELGVVSVKLSREGLALASRLKCVAAVDLDGVVRGQPSLGRGN